MEPSDGALATDGGGVVNDEHTRDEAASIRLYTANTPTRNARRARLPTVSTGHRGSPSGTPAVRNLPFPSAPPTLLPFAPSSIALPDPFRRPTPTPAICSPLPRRPLIALLPYAACPSPHPPLRPRHSPPPPHTRHQKSPDNQKHAGSPSPRPPRPSIYPYPLLPPSDSPSCHT
ncbi:hypothetical protein OF83DRAFT_1180702 [Amylostereum chailletii]|nr:hypothetical protein OF83DRAFT_1180702 [Amylostereum chailletii]